MYALWYQHIKRVDDRAQAMYERAVAADPENALKICNSAIFMYDVRGDVDRAEALLERAMPLDPECAGDLLNYAYMVEKRCAAVWIVRSN